MRLARQLLLFVPLLAYSPVSWSRLSVLFASLRSAPREGAYRWLPLAVRGRRLRPESGFGLKIAVVRRGTLVGLGLCRVCRRARRLRDILSVSWMHGKQRASGWRVRAKRRTCVACLCISSACVLSLSLDSPCRMRADCCLLCIRRDERHFSACSG